MANKNSRRTRRVASERKRRAGSGANNSGTSRELLLELAAELKATGGMPGDPNADDEDAEDKEGADDEEMMGLDDDTLDALFGSDEDDEDLEDKDFDEEGDDEDEEGDDSTDVSLSNDQIDALIDAALGVTDGDDDIDAADASLMSIGAKAKKLAAQKRAAAQKLAGQKAAAAKKVLAQINGELEGVKLPASVKKMLVQIALRQKQAEVKTQAEKKLAQIAQKRRQAKQAEKKSLQATEELVDALVEEKLMNTRSGRSFGFGGYETRERGAKTFDRDAGYSRGAANGRSFERGRAASVNQLRGGYRRGTPEFKLVDMMRATVDEDFRRQFKREVKALGGATGSAGGYTVPEEWTDDFIRLLRPKSVFRQFARIYPMANDTLHLPKQTGAANADWVGENVDLTSGMSDQTFAEVIFTAHKLRAFSISSNELLADSPYSAEKIIREDLRDVIVLKEDYTALLGPGTGSAPSGIYQLVPSGNKLVGSGTSNALIGDDLYRMMRAVQKNNAKLDCWIVNSDGLLAIQELKDNNGNYLFSENNGVNAPQPVVEAPFGEDPEDYNVPVGKLLGRDVYIENQIVNTVTITSGAPAALTGSTNTLLFGGMKKNFLIGQRAQIEIAASNVAGDSFKNDQTYFRAILREDFQVSIPGSWAVLAFPTPA